MSQTSTGYSVTRNPTIFGSRTDGSSFWQSDKQHVHVQFVFSANPNAYLIQQIGRSTILDFFSKIFALISAGFAILAFGMSNMERLWKLIQHYRKKREPNTSETEATPKPMELQDVAK